MIILIRAYAHEVLSTFLTQKNSQLFSCAPDGVRTSGVSVLESDALPTEPPRRFTALASEHVISHRKKLFIFSFLVVLTKTLYVNIESLVLIHYVWLY